MLRLRAELVSDLAAAKGADAVVELDQSKVGRLSRMDAMQGQAMAKASTERRHAALQRISVALKRIDSGEYGYCAECDQPISPGRLEFDPAALTCIDCASQMEGS